MQWYISLNNDKDILIHSGIKGQKWGVRRFQNDDGSLTSAGKERYKNMMPSSAASSYQKSKERTRNSQRSSGNIEYNRFLYEHGYEKQSNPSSSYLIENAISDEQSKFKKWSDGKSRDSMVEEIDRKYAVDSEEYGKDIADRLRTARNDVVRSFDSERNQNEQINSKAKMAQSRINAAMKAMPVSARKAQNEARMKANIPASAWDQRIRALGR